MSHVSAQRRILLRAGFAGVLSSLMNTMAVAKTLEVSGEDRGESEPAKAILLSAQTRLGMNLVGQLANGRQKGTNIVVSPASLASILSFVELGGSDPMRSAIRRTLGIDPDAKSRADKDMEALRSSVVAMVGKSGKDAPLALANLLVFDPSTRPRQSALHALSHAGADVLVNDLTMPKTIDRINGRVRQATHGLIPSIMEKTPEELGLVAVNALYFKDRWKMPFDPARSRIEPFQPLLGNKVDVMMMHSHFGKFAFRQDDHFIGVELPYEKEGFKLVVITTKSTPVGAPDFAAVDGWLGGQGFDVSEGEVGLPKIFLSAEEELLSPLDALGLRAARLVPGSLNRFSSSPLTITGVVQRLELRINEEGTEAAAATAVRARTTSLHSYVTMIVDKPFMFSLRDQKTGLFPFVGYIGAPPKIPSNKS
jgi:serine protease inhibitor